MIRGARKQMIVVRTGKSRYFDTAYFVLRTSPENTGARSEDILSEANRLLRENDPQSKAPPSSRKCFCLGLLCGGGSAALVSLLIFLL